MKPVGGGNGDVFCDQGVGACENAAAAANNSTMAARKSLVFTDEDLIFIKREFIMPNQASSTLNSIMMFALCAFGLKNGRTKYAHCCSDGRVGLGES